MTSKAPIRIEIDEFFAENPHRDLYARLETDGSGGVDTFLVVTRRLDVIAFDRTRTDGDVQASDLVAWFNTSDEGQATLARLAAGMTEDPRPGAEIQADGALLLTPTDAQVH